MSESDNRTRILIVRPDRLGDVILSTPVFEIVKRNYPNSYLVVLIRAEHVPVISNLPSIDEVIVYEPQGKHAKLKGIWRLGKQLRAYHFRIAVVLQSNWRLAFSIFLAGIRYRVGPLSKMHSFFFFNRGIRQKRSLVEMHETDYNLQLLRRIGARVSSRAIEPKIAVSETAREFGRKWLEARGWQSSQPIVAVHPGMGGSALNWPESHYVDLIRMLIRDGQRVLVTAGPTEGEMLSRYQNILKESLGDQSTHVFFYGGVGAPPVDHLAGVFSWVDVVVAPSTGPLHMAVALGKRVVSFYPPIRVQSAIRWGPYVKDDSKAHVFIPDVYCGEDFKCRGTLCNYFPCMKSLTVNEVFTAVKEHLNV